MASAVTQSDSGGKVKKDLAVRLKTFYGDVRSEMKKVTVPSWKEVQGTTGVVLVTVAIFGIFFYIVDKILLWAVDAIIVHFSR